MKKAMKHELESKIELYLMHLKDDLARVRALKDTDNIDFKYARLDALNSHAKALADFTDIYLTDAFEMEPDEMQKEKENSRTYGIFSKDIVSYLQTLTDLTESGNEIVKVESIRSADGKDRYYIVLYHKKEEGEE